MKRTLEIETLEDRCTPAPILSPASLVTTSRSSVTVTQHVSAPSVTLQAPVSQTLTTKTLATPTLTPQVTMLSPAAVSMVFSADWISGLTRNHNETLVRARKGKRRSR